MGSLLAGVSESVLKLDMGRTDASKCKILRQEIFIQLLLNPESTSFIHMHLLIFSMCISFWIFISFFECPELLWFQCGTWPQSRTNPIRIKNYTFFLDEVPQWNQSKSTSRTHWEFTYNIRLLKKQYWQFSSKISW